ncbi:DUF5724 domain-containing protein [Acaryochloris marina]|uniref:DUF4132 domain-containing protein n=1 Tax=Acaryochloris marina (strain MBIC 11017) TaxID=329726 RepID=B0C5Y2_ACAM1|nr:DUF5724 domain-containing protein [Acaryochloris marina]ABW29994.1 conserved hypothetical protein [Acaryochloris marina MBIC11017]
MLNRELAQESLKKFRVEEWSDRRATELAALPDHLNHIGRRMLRLDDSLYEWDHPYNREPYWQPCQDAIELSESERSQLFEVLFPQISDYVLLAYDLITTLPYQVGYSRRAFRSDHPEHHEFARRNFIQSLLGIVRGYEQPLDWYAAWAPYLGYSADLLGRLFAAAINQGDALGDQIFETLCDSARGDHEIGAMGRHVTRALLVANRPEGWELIENLLVAAQRQEGLRQTILETIDEAHPQAFQRIVRVILEHNLVRFSATIRAVDVWFGLGWEVEHQRRVQESLELLLQVLEHPNQRTAFLQNDDPNRVYLALWSLAFENVDLAIPPAVELLKTGTVEQRFVAAYLLRQLDTSQAREALIPSLADNDIRVAVQAYLSLGCRAGFEALETFINRFSAKETSIEPLVWSWMNYTITLQSVADNLVRSLGDRPVEQLMPYRTMMGEWGRIEVGKQLIKQTWDDQTREVVFELIRDRSSYVREQIMSALNAHRYCPTAPEAQTLESMLYRKAADLRRGVLSLLLKQEDDAVIESAQRLLSQSKAPQRKAGLELLVQLQQTDRGQVKPVAEAYASQRPKRTASEQELLDQLLADQQDIPTLDDALGLAPWELRSHPQCPKQPKHPIPLVSEAAQEILASLHALIDEHRTEEVVLNSDYPQEQLLGNLYWLPTPDFKLSQEENLKRLPLAEVWQTWLMNRPKALRDPDGLEIIRAIAACHGANSQPFHYEFGMDRGRNQPPKWQLELFEQWFSPVELTSPLIPGLLSWLIYLEPPQNLIDALLNAAQYTLAIIHQHTASKRKEWRHSRLLVWLNLARSHFRDHPTEWSVEQFRHLWQLLRWIDEPSDKSVPYWRVKSGETRYSYDRFETVQEGFIQRHRPELQEITLAYGAEAATDADFCDYLIGARPMSSRFNELRELTQRKPHPCIQANPKIGQIVNQCCDRILEVELTRGELPTAATEVAKNLSSIEGIATVVNLLQKLDNEKFIRGWVSDSKSRTAVLSHLCRVSFPGEDETPQDFAKIVKAAAIPTQQLVELAMYAPQWVNYIEHALRWKGFAEAVWWFHAHTKDEAWQVDADIRNLWAAQIAERTPLSSQDLLDGAVDVAWFQRIRKGMKSDRWTALNEAAKYTSGGGGHKRAQLFAEAMTGVTDRAGLIKRLQTKRHQDSVRALGLLPLARGKKRDADLLERYQIIQEFLRESRKFGSQRQASEKLAARISMDNLARTAGYPDPQRLEWAMEGMAIQDLATGAVSVEIDPVTVSLTITPDGKPQISVLKNGKSLKSVPAKLRKNPEIKALQQRKKEITQQASRITQSLEQSMCRGDQFTGTELKQLLAHPLLKPVLQRLVFIESDTGVAGLPQVDGLFNHDGQTVAITASMQLRIAHSVDLAERDDWHLWQQYCFQSELVQPFKQIFRELYVLTTAEQQGRGSGSCRYAGHQVNPRQSLALLGKRGWVAHPDEGIRRTFHDQQIVVWLEFEEGWYTPTEVEGFTLDQICFCDRTTYKPLELSAVPSRLFSEVMRDLDLVVSVAHQGGVDPEASASTVEMRASLLQETSRLLQLNNIQLQNSHALIEGKMGSYSVHLGSAMVHRQPGGAICVVPVHSQHRGRLFLPFADNDPKTAEVISKAIMLAKDHEIKDPTILEQIL